MTHPTDAEARQRLTAILDTAKTWKEIGDLIEAEYKAKTGAIFGTALRFIAERDPSGLDAVLRERFASALARIDDDGDTVEHQAALRKQ